MATQSLLGSVIVFHAQAHDRLTFRPRDEGIEIVNIELGFEKSGHETIEIGGICFDDDEVALGEGKVFGDEQFASAVRIVSGFGAATRCRAGGVTWMGGAPWSSFGEYEAPVLHLSRWDETLIAEEGALPVCGEGCAQKLQSQFMGNLRENEERRRA